MTPNVQPDELRCPSCGQSLGVCQGDAWTEERRALLLLLRRNGLPWKVLGRLFGVAADTLRYRAGHKPKPARVRRPPRPVSEAKRRALAKARAARGQRMTAPTPPYVR